MPRCYNAFRNHQLCLHRYRTALLGDFLFEFDIISAFETSLWFCAFYRSWSLIVTFMTSRYNYFKCHMGHLPKQLCSNESSIRAGNCSISVLVRLFVLWICMSKRCILSPWRWNCLRLANLLKFVKKHIQHDVGMNKIILRIFAKDIFDWCRAAVRGLSLALLSSIRETVISALVHHELQLVATRPLVKHGGRISCSSLWDLTSESQKTPTSQRNEIELPAALWQRQLFKMDCCLISLLKVRNNTLDFAKEAENILSQTKGNTFA